MSEDLAALEAKVRLMRQLGITEADGIKLGPPILPPEPEETKEEMLARLQKAAQRQHDTMFAHSGTKPRLPSAKVAK